MFRRVPANYVQKLVVWGAGTMGGGIAQVAAQNGIPTTVVVTSPERAKFYGKAIEDSLNRVAKKKCDGDAGKMKQYVDGIMKNIKWTANVEEAASDAEMIVEAVTEKVDLKRDLFKRLDQIAPKNAIFCTNTSSLQVSDIAKVTNRQDRFVGTHFFSPVPMMKLVEVVKTDKTDPKVVEEVCKFAHQIRKSPVIATDTLGFIVNRLFVPYLLEALRLVERGVATPQDVDTAMKLGCGYPMGPFELSDSIGIDTMKLVVDLYHEQLPNEPLFNPSKLYDDLVAAGKYGRKTGEGFYKYDSKGRRVE